MRDIDRVISIIEGFEPKCEQEESDRAQMLKFLMVSPDALTRENTMAHMSASAWVIDKSRTKALMIYHNIYKSWSWTGGHADGEWALHSVALREVNEETGVSAWLLSEQPLSIESLTVEAHIKRGKFVSPHIHMNASYLMEADETDITRVKPDENSGVMWVNFDDIENVVNEEYMKVIYRKIINRVTGCQKYRRT